jgi:A/G-specific adenine glycosylase
MSQNHFIPPKELPHLRRRLLTWYRHNKRDLDWRRTRDPYRIWLSEIMLQQTRVAAVIPYYRRFLARFPTVASLAEAPLDDVLHHWAGLGYYSRARNLQRAAKQIVAQHNGKFPRALEDALALPGVGRYTAAAVLSIAYNEPLAVLDGNVARVLARWAALRGELRQPRRWAQLAAMSQQVLATSAPSDWNQAMMELGATVCTPTAPRCEECPIAQRHAAHTGSRAAAKRGGKGQNESWCQAYAQGLTDQIPTPRAKPTTIRMTIAAAVLLDPQGHTLLLRHENSDGAFFSHLWQFPALEIAHRKRASRKPTTCANERAELASHIERALSIPAAALDFEPLATAKHAVTFHNIRLVPYLLRVQKLPATGGASTASLSDLVGATTKNGTARANGLPISNATRKIAKAALASLS